MCFQGVVPAGEGFKLNEEELALVGLHPRKLPNVVRPYIIGKDLVQNSKSRFIIDFFGLTEGESRDTWENAELSGRVDNFSKLGGSEVHAYCADGQTSRNTAGVESDCNRSGYQCEPVSGLCRTTCQTTDMCAAGWVCDTGIEQCIVPSGGN